MTKDERGNEGINVWLKRLCIGTLAYTMQFGKTFVGIKVMMRAIAKNKNVKIIVLVPSKVVRDVWERYISVYIQESECVRIITKDSLINLVQQDEVVCDILIIDEIHKFFTDAAYNAVLKIKTRFILGLTGTPPEKGEELVRLNSICPIIDTISEAEAIENGWISEYQEFNYVIEFPPEDKKRYLEYTEPITETLQLFKGTAVGLNKFLKAIVFKNDYAVVDACFRGVNHPYIKNIRFPGSDVRILVSSYKGWRMDLDLTQGINAVLNEYWNPLNIEDRVRAFDKLVRRRNNLMITHPLKLEKVNEVVTKFMKPTIIFNEATDFADAVCNSINRLGTPSVPICTVYHSNIESKFIRDDRGDYIRYKTGEKAGEPKKFGKTFLLQDTIDGMTTGRYLCLSTSKALEVGLSISNIEIVINTGGTTNPSTYKQRTARGKTVDIYNKDKKTLIVNIVFDNFVYETQNENGDNVIRSVKSRDLTKLIERQGENTDAKWVTSINEIDL